jgi:hypothetical protein
MATRRDFERAKARQHGRESARATQQDREAMLRISAAAQRKGASLGPIVLRKIECPGCGHTGYFAARRFQVLRGRCTKCGMLVVTVD